MSTRTRRPEFGGLGIGRQEPLSTRAPTNPTPLIQLTSRTGSHIKLRNRHVGLPIAVMDRGVTVREDVDQGAH
jgi:hypothetical protein